MPRAGFLALLGWYVAPRFFDAAECSRLRREMQCSRIDPARVLDEKNQFVIDQNKRKVDCALVSVETRALVTSRLMTAKPLLEKHFGIELASCEPPSFLVYRPGFFYGRHSDTDHNQDAPIKVRERRVSISIFLNGEGADGEPDTYSGGNLIFSGTRKDNEPGKYAGIALMGEEGLLIGFHADWPHEVQRVLRGVRYSIVTWFD